MEIVDQESGKPGCPPPHGDERAVRIQREALKRGLIIERGGRHGCVLRFLPPLIIKRAQIDRCLATIADSINASAT
jgi:diaminobutyrate-2-oxoglutarate transaminase